MKFKIGDSVILKSGGPYIPVMSVAEFDKEDGVLTCQWFDKDQRLQREKFHEDQLEKYEPQPTLTLMKHRNHNRY